MSDYFTKYALSEMNRLSPKTGIFATGKIMEKRDEAIV
jgi:hypothetical protein